MKKVLWGSAWGSSEGCHRQGESSGDKVSWMSRHKWIGDDENTEKRTNKKYRLEYLVANWKEAKEM